MAQWQVETGDLDPRISKRYEVMMLANGYSGNVVSTMNPLDVRTNTESLYSAPWDLQVSRGKVPDTYQVNIFGSTSNVTTEFHTVWDNTPTDILPPSSAVQMNVVSTSTSDNSNASVTIIGLDANWDIISEKIYLNGTTPVVTANSFLRINNMALTSPGTGQNTNVGVITAEYDAVLPIYAKIAAGNGRMQNAFYSVPRNYSLYVRNINIFAGESNQGNQPIWFDYRVRTRNNTNGVLTTILQTPFANEYKVQRSNPVKYEQYLDVEWQIRVNNGTHGVGIVLEAILISDIAL